MVRLTHKARRHLWHLARTNTRIVCVNAVAEDDRWVSERGQCIQTASSAEAVPPLRGILMCSEEFVERW